jgi:3-oxoacyl-[acyl-carrier protein] reductase
VLQGRRAVITGASRGIGAAVARRLAGEGARLVLASRDVDELRGVAPAGALCVAADVREQASVGRLFSAAGEAFGGRLDLLVNCAGVCYLEPLADMPLDQFDEMMATNVRGTLLCVRAAVPLLRAASGGDIVNLSSALAARPITAGKGGYGASKRAVDAMSEALAAELEPDRIIVHTLAPTWVDTPMRRALFAEDETWMAAGDVADALVFLLTRPANVAVQALRLLPRDRYHQR